MDYLPRTPITVPAPQAQRPFGIFSHLNEGPPARWLGGGVEARPTVAAGDLKQTVSAPDCEDGGPVIDTFERPPDFIPEDAFVITQGVECSAQGPSDDLTSWADRRFAANVEWRVEAQFAESHFTSGAEIPPVELSTDGTLIAAIADVEAEWASVTGELGVLHLPRAAYPFGLRENLFVVIDGKLYTGGGTPVVLGAGYPNTLSSGSDPDVGHFVVVITGPLYGYMGEPETHYYVDRATNTATYRIEQDFLVGHSGGVAYMASGLAT